ncbi:MAG: hypothetical protein A2X61_09890 [Ignavibacteria bacterium GWB2_35_12]|nr:MAG: hypothetical protein A2X63_10335 [Ignavibacteria bacterium GWA2_35_8]OGU39663.1 MAG: hypothetical protein A2X61_09890 [Ignavibacteria bacterium GWB2_35_12]OGU93577.1 MAG: hypothetical protein A2220_03355 [Ignavibacteria bacterium RIFOXYA2_FULL_35_10]OGV23857.1 MAG: hypothetical protein A2475_07085 [Ignavibacteria bacterium RIFOXYC2_FULL_35_21]
MTFKNKSENNIQERKSLKPLILTLPNDGSSYFKILNDSMSYTMRSGLVTLQSGQDVGSHNTENKEELLIILSGTGEVEAEGLGKQRIDNGCAVYIPPQTQHNIFNAGSEPLKYIYVFSTAR